MAASTIGRVTLTDDDGSGTTGTILNNALRQAHDDKIDAMFAGTGAYTTFEFGGGLKVDAAAQVVGILTAGSVSTPIITLTDGATIALNASLGNVFAISAAGNRTLLAPSNPRSGQKIIIMHGASGAARTLTLTGGTGGFAYCTDIPILTQTANGATDLFGAIYNGNAWLVCAYVKGF
jgi:hypothetical protein